MVACHGSTSSNLSSESVVLVLHDSAMIYDSRRGRLGGPCPGKAEVT